MSPTYRRVFQNRVIILRNDINETLAAYGGPGRAVNQIVAPMIMHLRSLERALA